MFFKKKDKKEEAFQEKKLKKSLDDNIQLIKDIFKQDDTLTIRRFKMSEPHSLECSIVFIEGMINIEVVNKNIIEPILNAAFSEKLDAMDSLQDHVIASHIIEKTNDIEKLIEGIIIGNTVLFLNGTSEALLITTKGWKFREITEPLSEKTIRGPREGFTEAFLINLTLLRRKLKTPKLKFKFLTLGVRAKTRVCICYLEGVANEKILEEVERRVKNIRIDGIIDTGYIEEFIRDYPISPFKTIGSTERPDVVSSRLLEGRIALVCDGSPNVLTMPYLFQEYFQSNEDYYMDYIFATINRSLRIMGFLITISVPGIFVAVATYHQEIFPTSLLLSISAARQGVPFPTVVEAIILLFIFEVLREASVRMPEAIGQTMSIVGALVLGQAAVDARLFSAPMIVIVALSGLTELIVPRFKGANIIVRFFLLLLAAFLGLYGFLFGLLILLIHLFSIRTFGIPYMLDYNSFDFQDFKDTMIRAPWWYMRYRPKFIGGRNRKREGTIESLGGKQ